MSRGDKEGIAIATAIIVFITVIYWIIFDIRHDKEIDSGPPPASPSQVERVYTPSECMVDVSNYTHNGRRSYGKGVIIENNGKTFVLTSSMIFTYMGEITIDYENVRYTAEIIDDAEIWGLVALECSFMEGTRTTKLNDDPNLPPSAKAWVGDTLIETREYMNDYWVIVDTNLSADMTGAPVEQGTELVGIVVGLNCINEKQAIMVGNRALREFCDQVAPDAPPAVYTPKGPSWY